MCSLCKLQILLLTLLLLTATNKMTKGAETSAEYLHNVMIELQGLNVPRNDRIDDSSGKTGYNIGHRADHGEQEHVVRKINQNVRQDFSQFEGHRFHDMSIEMPAITSPYYQVRPSTIIDSPKGIEPEVLGLTRGTLAAMYKDALNKGTPISLSSLSNALASGNTPQIIGSHLELPMRRPMPAYQYHFFPLKTFASQLKKGHEYNTLIAPAIVETAETTNKESQNQLSNPLFVAISTFISMTLLFMMGILFLPRLGHLGGIYPREIQDHSVSLTNLAVDSIARRDFLKNLDDYRLKSYR